MNYSAHQSKKRERQNWVYSFHVYKKKDETPENCEIFLDECDGMNAFMDCIKFNKSEIIRNMMGLLVSYYPS